LQSPRGHPAHRTKPIQGRERRAPLRKRVREERFHRIEDAKSVVTDAGYRIESDGDAVPLEAGSQGRVALRSGAAGVVAARQPVAAALRQVHVLGAGVFVADDQLDRHPAQRREIEGRAELGLEVAHTDPPVAVRVQERDPAGGADREGSS